MIKLINILKEITEAKQVGNLYNFTPISNLKSILETRSLIPNDENAVSTSIRPNMSTRGFQDMRTDSIVRIMLDGDKISTKYKIRPFAYGEGGDHEDLGEEQIIVDGKKFYFVPYLKRIDIFLNKKKAINPKILELLEKANIPYKVYQGVPFLNTPYSQPKTGNPEDIDIEKIPEKRFYTEEELYYPPNMKPAKYIEYYQSKGDLDAELPSEVKVYTSPEYPGYYIFAGFNRQDWIKWYDNYYTLKGEKFPYKMVPIPMYDDPKWRKMWKKEEIASKSGGFGNHIRNSYILIPKNEVD